MNAETGGLEGIHRGRLFVGSCISLIATSVTFAVIADIMGPLKEVFLLTNQDVGWIAGAGLFGFPISIFVFGPLVDVLGMRFLLRLACLCQLTGALLMIFATGFWTLFFGSLTIALGNGLVEAAGNPLVATLYPDRKTEKLNQFHVWFPGGIVIGGLFCFLLSKMNIASYQIRLALILVPTVIYGIMFLAEKFPKTERVQAGVSFTDMCKATFFRPLFLVLMVCMMITASLELGPNRWLPSVYAAGGMPGILVLVWISGLMAVMRYFAGHAVERLAPTGILLASAVLAGIGLWLLSISEGFAFTFLAATVFAVGVCYFWPTMLGVAAERVPRGGALALALLGGIGNVGVGVIATPLMGHVADLYAHSEMDQTETRAALERVIETFPALVENAEGDRGQDYQAVITYAQEVLAEADAAGGELPLNRTEEALRKAKMYAQDPQEGAPEGVVAAREAAKAAGAIIDPLDNFGGRMSFRWISPFAIFLVIVFGIMYLRDLARGGYKAEEITA